MTSGAAADGDTVFAALKSSFGSELACALGLGCGAAAWSARPAGADLVNVPNNGFLGVLLEDTSPVSSVLCWSAGAAVLAGDGVKRPPEEGGAAPNIPEGGVGALDLGAPNSGAGAGFDGDAAVLAAGGKRLAKAFSFGASSALDGSFVGELAGWPKLNDGLPVVAGATSEIGLDEGVWPKRAEVFFGCSDCEPNMGCDDGFGVLKPEADDDSTCGESGRGLPNKEDVDWGVSVDAEIEGFSPTSADGVDCDWLKLKPPNAFLGCSEAEGAAEV